VKKEFAVLFVCTGNTCRSPLAERILKHRVKEMGWEGIGISSAGTGALEGLSASEGAKRAARNMGISLARFKSKPVNGRRVARADLIITMTPGHAHDIGIRWPDALEKTHVITDYTGSPRRGIADPVGGDDLVYERCAADLSEEIERMLPRIAEAVESKRRAMKGHP
jgi:protein-tyrosine-phosphatase